MDGDGNYVWRVEAGDVDLVGCGFQLSPHISGRLMVVMNGMDWMPGR